MMNILIKSTKILIVFLIFYYLVKNNHLNFDIFFKLTSSTLLTILLSFFIFSTYIIGSYRWSLILKSTNIKNTFFENFKIYYMCTFFNNFLFGNLGGDFIKIYYVSNLSKNNKIKNSFSIAIDRIFGFLGLIALGIISACLILFNQNEIKLILIIVSSIIIFFLLIFFTVKFLKKILIIKNFLRYFNLNIFICIKCLILSSIIFFLVHTSIYIISNKIFGFNIDLNHIFFSNFVSLFLSALPVSPGGIGIGEIAFVFINENLFNTYINNLANVIIYFRLIVFITSLPGIFFFINYKKNNTKLTF